MPLSSRASMGCASAAALNNQNEKNMLFMIGPVL
jgi:hypothetical protein